MPKTILATMLAALAGLALGACAQQPAEDQEGSQPLVEDDDDRNRSCRPRQVAIHEIGVRIASAMVLMITARDDEVARMREQIGRPDYSVLVQTLGQQAIVLSKVSSAPEEMWVIRAQAARAQDDDVLMQRLASLEMQLAALTSTTEEKWYEGLN